VKKEEKYAYISLHYPPRRKGGFQKCLGAQKKEEGSIHFPSFRKQKGESLKRKGLSLFLGEEKEKRGDRT